MHTSVIKTNQRQRRNIPLSVCILYSFEMGCLLHCYNILYLNVMYRNCVLLNLSIWLSGYLILQYHKLLHDPIMDKVYTLYCIWSIIFLCVGCLCTELKPWSIVCFTLLWTMYIGNSLPVMCVVCSFGPRYTTRNSGRLSIFIFSFNYVHVQS